MLARFRSHFNRYWHRIAAVIVFAICCVLLVATHRIARAQQVWLASEQPASWISCTNNTSSAAAWLLLRAGQNKSWLVDLLFREPLSSNSNLPQLSDGDAKFALHHPDNYDLERVYVIKRGLFQGEEMPKNVGTVLSEYFHELSINIGTRQGIFFYDMNAQYASAPSLKKVDRAQRDALQKQLDDEVKKPSSNDGHFSALLPAVEAAISRVEADSAHPAFRRVLIVTDGITNVEIERTKVMIEQMTKRARAEGTVIDLVLLSDAANAAQLLRNLALGTGGQVFDYKNWKKEGLSAHLRDLDKLHARFALSESSVALGKRYTLSTGDAHVLCEFSLGRSLDPTANPPPENPLLPFLKLNLILSILAGLFSIFGYWLVAKALGSKVSAGVSGIGAEPLQALLVTYALPRSRFWLCLLPGWLLDVMRVNRLRQARQITWLTDITDPRTPRTYPVPRIPCLIGHGGDCDVMLPCWNATGDSAESGLFALQRRPDNSAKHQLYDHHQRAPRLVELDQPFELLGRQLVLKVVNLA